MLSSNYFGKNLQAKFLDFKQLSPDLFFSLPFLATIKGKIIRQELQQKPKHQALGRVQWQTARLSCVQSLSLQGKQRGTERERRNVPSTVSISSFPPHPTLSITLLANPSATSRSFLTSMLSINTFSQGFHSSLCTGLPATTFKPLHSTLFIQQSGSHL